MGPVTRVGALVVGTDFREKVSDAHRCGGLIGCRTATELARLRIPPGNQLEALRADRKGQHSIRGELAPDPVRCHRWHLDNALLHDNMQHVIVRSLC
jgi:hypothetical protein